MPTVTFRLSDEAHRGFLIHARAHGITLTAMIEAMGQMMAKHRGEGVLWPETIDLARDIDAERRRRG